MQCVECGREIKERGVKCSTCAAALHQECAKKVLGKWYCRRCYKQAKKSAKFELMARRDYLTKKLPKKIW
jgi:late competence protein required for DNA uptake (superfamily II DNA/RNA helicase)